MVMEPINPKVQKQYRDTLIVSKAPTFIETDNEIVPTVNLNTSENPVLTSQIERGTLQARSNSPTPSVSYNYSIFTVPNNKKWILKAVENATASLVGTASEVGFEVRVSSVLIRLANQATGTSKMVTMIPGVITLSEGSTVEVYTQLTAYTSGTITHKILYQELDEEQL